MATVVHETPENIWNVVLERHCRVVAPSQQAMEKLATMQAPPSYASSIETSTPDEQIESLSQWQVLSSE